MTEIAKIASIMREMVNDYQIHREEIYQLFSMLAGRRFISLTWFPDYISNVSI